VGAWSVRAVDRLVGAIVVENIVGSNVGNKVGLCGSKVSCIVGKEVDQWCGVDVIIGNDSTCCSFINTCCPFTRLHCDPLSNNWAIFMWHNRW
jgi:hypothetical protein